MIIKRVKRSMARKQDFSSPLRITHPLGIRHNDSGEPIFEVISFESVQLGHLNGGFTAHSSWHRGRASGIEG